MVSGIPKPIFYATEEEAAVVRKILGEYAAGIEFRIDPRAGDGAIKDELRVFIEFLTARAPATKPMGLCDPNSPEAATAIYRPPEIDPA